MSKFFINRPIVAMVIAILMVIVGAVTITGLPVALFPNIVPPEVQVVATYVGADAQTIEQSVATPIEQQKSGVDNMNYMYSLNSTADGVMRLIVDYDVKTDPNTDLILTQIRSTQAASQLPVDVRILALPSRRRSPLPSCYSLCTLRRGTTMRGSSPTTPISILPIKSLAFTALEACKFLAPASTRCGCGSSPTSWPSLRSPFQKWSAQFSRKIL